VIAELRVAYVVPVMEKLESMGETTRPDLKLLSEVCFAPFGIMPRASLTPSTRGRRTEQVTHPKFDLRGSRNESID